MSLLHYFLICIGIGSVGLALVWYLFARISGITVDDAKAEYIASAIREGAMTFLNEEYKVIAVVAAIVAVLLGLYSSALASGLFIAGAICSLATGYLGMQAATLANVRTTMAAKNNGEYAAFMIAFFGGGVMGFAVASIGLLGLATVFYVFYNHPDFLFLLMSFALGASLVAFFARVGGGIYTKSADVGADLVGKIEAGIPEDDPRNPAVIADNVGDCVGDTAGMGADIYESYIGATVSSIVLAVEQYGLDNMALVALPLMLIALGLIASFVGVAVNVLMPSTPARMLNNATYLSLVALAVFSYGYISYMGLPFNLFISITLGCLAGIIVGKIAEYYTSGAPIIRIAESARSGAATNVIYGLSVGMESVVAPVIILVGIVVASYKFGGGLFGVSLAAVAMLATVGITMTVDGYGPIADNAGGISEMSGFGKSVRDITDKLDALGNTTAAMGKGFAIGSALVTALAMLSAFAQAAKLPHLDVLDPLIMAGMFIGAATPFLISALTMRAVSEAALKMVFEVRRQFKEIPGLMEGTGQPDYKRCVAISTQASLREMILPGIITVSLPVIIKYTMGKAALGGLLIGITVSGVLLALMMANAGGAWDNAKKYI
jgi:K(+)-stimulated pyrophosphate-energized sodium pump